MLLTIFGIIAAILVLSILIAVHEAGHLLMAKWSNIRVDIFSIGMGKPIWGFQYGETYYQIGRLPFGGFCAFGTEEKEIDPDPRALVNSPLWARLLTVIGGSLFNLIFAFLVMILLFTFGFKEKQITNQVFVSKTISLEKDSPILSPAWEAGLRSGDTIISISDQSITHFSQIPAALAYSRGTKKKVIYVRDNKTNSTELTTVVDPYSGMEVIGVIPVQPAFVSNVLSGSPAERSGIKAGDLIQSINGKKIQFFYQLQENITNNQSIILEINRNNIITNITLKPENISNQWKIGVVGVLPQEIVVLKKANNPIQAIQYATQYLFSTISKMISSIVKLFSGQVNLEKNLSGPVRIVSITGTIAQTMDFSLVLQFMVMLSTALAIFNLMPIPGLDGGALILQTARSLFKNHPAAEKIINFIEQAGVMLLLVLAVFVLFNDVKNISQDRRAKTQQEKE